MIRWFSVPMLLASALAVSNPAATFACAACFGKSDSSMAQGMNMGILALLVVITGVLGAVAGFFIFLARKAGKAAAEADSRAALEPITHS